MAIERVKDYFRKYGIEDRIQEFEVSSATVELAAQALQCEPSRIAKTLSFMVEEKVILIVTAGDTKIDNAKYKAQFHAKAKMLTPEEAESMIGHAVGGVCPFAVNDGVDIYLDVSMKRFQTVFPACGSSNSAIELTMEELEKLVGNVDNEYKYFNGFEGILTKEARDKIIDDLHTNIRPNVRGFNIKNIEIVYLSDLIKE